MTQANCRETDPEASGWTAHMVCTLPEEHDGLHEAWGYDDEPYHVWGEPEPDVITVPLEVELSFDREELTGRLEVLLSVGNAEGVLWYTPKRKLRRRLAKDPALAVLVALRDAIDAEDEVAVGRALELADRAIERAFE